MQPHVEDLLALMKMLNLVPAHLVGSSWGGFIALLAAMQDPGAVKSLVLCEPPVIPLFISNSPGPGELARLFIRRPVDAVRIARFGIRVLEPTIKAYRAGDIERGGRIFGMALLGKERFASLPEETAQMVRENESAEVAQMLGAGFPALKAADVRGIAAPTLLVAGRESGPLFRLTLLRELERLLPNASRIEIPSASHLMQEDNPPEFNAAVLSFIEGNP